MEVRKSAASCSRTEERKCRSEAHSEGVKPAFKHRRARMSRNASGRLTRVHVHCRGSWRGLGAAQSVPLTRS
jgi:hypothetical protein